MYLFFFKITLTNYKSKLNCTAPYTVPNPTCSRSYICISITNFWQLAYIVDEPIYVHLPPKVHLCISTFFIFLYAPHLTTCQCCDSLLQLFSVQLVGTKSPNMGTFHEPSFTLTVTKLMTPYETEFYMYRDLKDEKLYQLKSKPASAFIEYNNFFSICSLLYITKQFHMVNKFAR